MTLTEAQFRNGLVATGIAQVGHLYRDSSVPTNWPPQQFDCSTFTHWLFARYGVNLDRGSLQSLAWPPAEPVPWHKYEGYTLTQQGEARRRVALVSYSGIKPGDLLYYDKPGQHHVVMYIGGGRVVHAAGTAYGVIISNIVPPGVIGHGGKTLTICVSATRFAAASGYKFSIYAPPTRPTVFLSHILAAIRADGPAAQGHTTYKAEVLLVENALYKEGLLRSGLVDGSAGTSSFGLGSAYQKYQQRLNYSGNDADGIPGIVSLKTLGTKYGFSAL